MSPQERRPLPPPRSPRGGAATVPDPAVQTMRVLVILVLIALAMITIATFLLWRVADHTANGGGTAKTSSSTSSQQSVPQLPPPSPAGSGKLLAKQLSGTSSGIKQLLAAIQNADLGALSPSLRQVTRNTAELAQTVMSFSSLATTAGELTKLVPAVASLQGRLTLLNGAIDPLAPGLATTNQRLAGATTSINGTNKGLKQLVKLLGGLTGTLAQVKQSLDDTRKSLDETNRCLHTPGVCKDPTSP